MALYCSFVGSRTKASPPILMSALPNDIVTAPLEHARTHARASMQIHHTRTHTIASKHPHRRPHTHTHTCTDTPGTTTNPQSTGRFVGGRPWSSTHLTLTNSLLCSRSSLSFIIDFKNVGMRTCRARSQSGLSRDVPPSCLSPTQSATLQEPLLLTRVAMLRERRARLGSRVRGVG